MIPSSSGGRPTTDMIPPRLQQLQVVIEGIGGGNGRQNQIELALVVGKEIGVLTRCQHPLRAELIGFLFLAQGPGNDGDLSPLGGGDLHTHVAQSAKANDGYLIALLDLPPGQGRVGGNTSAQERGGDIKVEAFWNRQHEILIDHDLLRIATLGNGSINVFRVIGSHRAVQAVLLLPIAALLADPAGIDQAAHTHAVARLKLGDLVPYRFDHAGDLVTHRQREVGLAPLIANGVNIRVANSGRLDIDDDVILARIAAFDFYGAKGCIWARFLQNFRFNWHVT